MICLQLQNSMLSVSFEGCSLTLLFFLVFSCNLSSGVFASLKLLGVFEPGGFPPLRVMKVSRCTGKNLLLGQFYHFPRTKQGYTFLERVLRKSGQVPLGCGACKSHYIFMCKVLNIPSYCAAKGWKVYSMYLKSNKTILTLGLIKEKISYN